MGRASWLALPLLAALGGGAWWIFGRDQAPAPLTLDDEGSAPETEGPGTEAELRAGPRAMSAGGAATSIASPYRIVGTVVDEKGALLADVAVRAHAWGTARDPEDISTWNDPKADAVRKELAGLDDPKTVDRSQDPGATSDKEGRFEITVPEAGNFEVAGLPIPGRVSTKAWANPTKMKPVAKATVRMVAGSALEGRVVDADDKGVVGFVSGTFTIGEATSLFNVVDAPSVATDSNGAFTLTAVPEGKGTLTVRIPGRGSFTGFSVVVPSKEIVILRIGAGGAVKGKVADASGQPIAGADLSITTQASKAPARGSPRGAVVRGKTQSDGTYRIEGVPPGLVKRATAAAVGFPSLAQSPPGARWSGAEVKEAADTNFDLVMARGGTVVGRVVDVSEKGAEAPIPNAEVFLLGPAVSNGGAPSTAPRAMAVDRNGAFRFEDVALGKYILYARSPSHYLPVDAAGQQSMRGGRVLRSAGPDGGAPMTTTLVLTKEAETFEKNISMLKGLPVSGLVKGPDGAPVAGAKVLSPGSGDEFLNNQWQYGLGGQNVLTLATSGPDGRFTIPGLRPGDACVLTASKPPLAGKPSKPFKVKADAPTPEVTLELEKGATVAGRVVDADGAPVSGANVQCYAQDGSGGNATETTGIDGAFRLEGLPPGKYQLWSWSNTGVNAQKQLDPELTSGEVREGVELKMATQKKGSKLSGTLVDEEGGPIAYAHVSAQGSNGSNAWSQTDADGGFTFQNLAEGKVTISVQIPSADGGTMGQEKLQNATFDCPGEGIKLVVTKKTTTTIAGRVLLPDGSPVPLCLLATKSGESKDGGSRVISSGGMVFADAMWGGGGGGEVVNGEFRREVALKPPFDVVVSGAKDAEGRPLNLRSSTTKITESVAGLEIRLDGGLEIRGRVLGADGAAVVGAWVSTSVANDRTVEDGSFRLVGLEGDEVAISVVPTEKYTAPAKPTKAKPGATDVVIRLEAGLAIAGRIVDPVGAPITNAFIQVMGGSGGGRNHFNAQADAQGAFRVENLPRDGTYEVRVQVWDQGGGRKAGYKPWIQSGVKAGTDDLVVRLETGEAIEGTVVDADGKPVAQAWVNAQPVVGGKQGSMGGNTDDQGRFTCGGLDAGATYVLTAQTWNGQQRRSLPVRAETGARDVKLVFPATARLTGRLTGDGDKAGFAITVRPTGSISGDADGAVGNGQSIADGTFSLDVPLDIALDVYASKTGDDRFGFVAGVRGGGADVAVRLEVGKSIEGTLEDADGNPIGQNGWILASNESWRSYGVADATGKWKLRGLPPGRYRLRPMNVGSAKTAAVVEADAGAINVRIRVGG